MLRSFRQRFPFYRYTLIVLAVVSCLVLIGSMSRFKSDAGGSPVIIFAHDRLQNRLMSFDAASPGVFLFNTPLMGLNPNERLVGIDFRPGDGLLYGVATNGTASRVVTISTTNGSVASVGSGFSPPLSLSVSYGFDFYHPLPRPIRLLETRTNLELSSITGTLSSTGTNPAFISGDPNFGETPVIDMIAYATPVGDGSTLFGIENLNGVLVRIGGVNGNPSASNGQVTTIGSLGIQLTRSGGFDIDAATGVAYGTFNERLYTVNLQTGQATLVGNLPTTFAVDGIAIAPRAVVPTPTPTPTPTPMPTRTPTPTPTATPVPSPSPVSFSLPLIGVGPDAGEALPARVFSPTGQLHAGITPFGSGFMGGIRVATGDVNGDGAPDLVAAPGGGSLPIVVISGRDGTQVRGFVAFPGFNGGVSVAVGDVNGDGRADIITGAGPGGGPHVKVFSGVDNSVLHDFFAFPSSSTLGVTVAAGDVNADGFEDVITGPANDDGAAAGHVRVFSGASGAPIRDFLPYTGFSGGIFVASGDVNSDGTADIVVGTSTGSPHVKVFDGRDLTELRSFFAYAPGFQGGVRVATGDVNGDGFADVVTGAGPGGGPHVKAFSGKDLAELSSFFAYAGQRGEEDLGGIGQLGIYVTGAGVRPATATVTGRVTTPTGLGVRNAFVGIFDRNNVRRIAVTSSFGIFSFDNVPTGEPYIVSAFSKRFRFSPRNIVVNGPLNAVDLVGLE